MVRTGLVVLALLAGMLSTGCVTRRVMITSDPSGAMVYHNGQPIGTTPVNLPFTYYGTYHFRLERDGCEPADFYPTLVAPWYQWPGVDLVTETLIPYYFRDRQALHFQLQPARTHSHDQIRSRASELQEMGRHLHPHPGAQPAPTPQPAPLPPPTPLPPTGG